VQPTHATSDMYWAEDRIGKQRLTGAYAYKKLLNSFGMIAAGSRFPGRRYQSSIWVLCRCSS
jgi:predicted amidohydrolase YtcJ